MKIEVKHNGKWVKVWEGKQRGRSPEQVVCSEVGVYRDNLETTDDPNVHLDVITGELYRTAS